MEDNDTRSLRLAAAGVTRIDIAYRLADGPGQFALLDVRDQAWFSYMVARQKLLMVGVIVTDEQLAELEQVAEELDHAETINALASSGVKLAGWLARIALV